MPLRKSKGKAKAVEDPPDLFRHIRHPDVIDFLESMRTPRSFSATLRSKDPNGVSDLLLKFQRTLPYIRAHLQERAKFPHDLDEVNYLYPVRKFYLEVLDDQGREDAKGCCPDARFPDETLVGSITSSSISSDMYPSETSSGSSCSQSGCKLIL
ncbi:hypothetical protein C8R43DRAFT_1131477 [Mycena crocata]|nr:hypothetical protein C8R43DRAFT_1131477 [Mycena crocata]